MAILATTTTTTTMTTSTMRHVLDLAGSVAHHGWYMHYQNKRNVWYDQVTIPLLISRHTTHTHVDGVENGQIYTPARLCQCVRLCVGQSPMLPYMRLRCVCGCMSIYDELSISSIYYVIIVAKVFDGPRTTTLSLWCAAWLSGKGRLVCTSFECTHEKDESFNKLYLLHGFRQSIRLWQTVWVRSDELQPNK